MEHKIGEIFEDGGVKLKVEKSIIGCRDCHFLHVTYCENNSNCEACNSLERKDKTDVIFVKVKDNTNNNKDMETRNIKLDLKTAKEWFKGGDETLKKLALQAYKEEELKDNLPKTWEEFCENNPIQEGEVYIGLKGVLNEYTAQWRRDTIKNALPNSKSAEAHLALMQLEQLRDCYRNGWVPNWEYDEHKYVIYNCKNKIIFNTDIDGTSHFLAFPTMELCEKFYNNFKDLIEIAKDLI